MKKVTLTSDYSQLHTVNNQQDEMRILLNYNESFGFWTFAFWSHRDRECMDLSGSKLVTGRNLLDPVNTDIMLFWSGDYLIVTNESEYRQQQALLDAGINECGFLVT